MENIHNDPTTKLILAARMLHKLPTSGGRTYEAYDFLDTSSDNKDNLIFYLTFNEKSTFAFEK